MKGVVMQYKNMGRTGLKVSRICLGTMTFGTQVGETEAINLIKRRNECRHQLLGYRSCIF